VCSVSGTRDVPLNERSNDRKQLCDHDINKFLPPKKKFQPIKSDLVEKTQQNDLSDVTILSVEVS